MSNITDKFAIYKIIELLVNKTEAEKLTLVQMRANKSIGKKEYFEQLKKSVTEILLLTQKSLFSLSLKSGISYNSLYPTLKQPVTAKLNNLEPALPITSREDIATNAVAIIKDLKYDIEHLSVKMERLLNKDNKKINTTENQNKHWEKAVK